MPSQPLRPSWGFGPVYDLLDSDSTDVGTPPLLPRYRPFLNGCDDFQSEQFIDKQKLHLGTFDRKEKAWEEVGFSTNAFTIKTPPPAVLPVELEGEDQSSSDEALASPSTGKGNTHKATGSLDSNSNPGPISEESGRILEDSLSGMSKKQRSKARKHANKVKKAELLLQNEEERKQKELRVQTPAKAKPSLNSASKQTAARSRSNIGAKIRPDSPVQITASTPTQGPPPVAIPKQNQPSTPSPIPPSPSINTELQRRISSTQPPQAFIQPSNPPMYIPQPTSLAPIGFSAPLPTSFATPGAPPAPTNLQQPVNPQYRTVATPVTYQNQLSPGFATPYAPMNPGLVPSVVRPLTTRNNSKKLKNILTRSLEDKQSDFVKSLTTRFPEDRQWLVSPMPHVSSSGIHVFIDASNILIGFRAMLRSRGIHNCDMDFDYLALLLERRRPVAKRVYVGSTRGAAPIMSNEKFNASAGPVGYEQNIYEQVYKIKELTESQKFFKNVETVGWDEATRIASGIGPSGSGGPATAPPGGYNGVQQGQMKPLGTHPETGALPTTPPPAPKWVEQGVDETLHLKMADSIMDTEVPTTMVLATGDGAEAEYSGGFLAYVERALKRGWRVELVSWRQQTSSGYRDKKFKAKWGDKFRIIELDEFLHFMIDASV